MKIICKNDKIKLITEIAINKREKLWQAIR